jgi:hypothetical protein
MWERRTIKLDKSIKITARPGNNVFIANRGEVSFEYPKSWIVKPTDTAICLHDAEPPNDQCILEFSILHLDFSADWSKVPLAQLLCAAVGGESGPLDQACARQVQRGDLKIAWLEREFMEPVEKRPALSRSAVALRAEILPLFTFSFWPEDKLKREPVWSCILETLRLAEGQRFKRRN